MSDTQGGLPGLKDVLGAFATSWQVAAGIALSGSALLYGKFSGYPFAVDLPDWFATIVFVFVVAAYAIWLIRILQGVSSLIHQWIDGVRYKRAIRRELDTLSDEEREVLAHFVKQKQNAFRARLIEEKIATLVGRGLVERIAGQHSRLDWPYRIPNSVWKEINSSAGRRKLGLND
jgi:hypothetical protein